MGTTRASLQSCGISPWSRVCWYIRANIGASWLADALMINAGISSGHVALWGCCFFSSLYSNSLCTDVDVFHSRVGAWLFILKICMVFFSKHWMELVIEYVGFTQIVTLYKSSLIFKRCYSTEFLAFAFNIGPELVPIFSIAYYVFYIRCMAILVSLCTSCCNLLYISRSLFFLVRLAFSCALCFWLVFRRIFVFIHRWVCRALVIFVGTLWSMILLTAVLKWFHILSMLSKVWSLKF